MSKRIYVEIDDLKPLVEWLKTRPDGECRVLIGGSSDALPKLMSSMQLSTTLAKWLIGKMQAGEMQLKAIADKTDLPVGIVVESEE